MNTAAPAADLFARAHLPLTAADPNAAPPCTAEQLEQLFVDGDRKNFFKALSQDRRDDVAAAVGLVAREKARSSAIARAGVRTDSFAWITRRPDVAKACAVLHGVLIDISAIPMADLGDDI